MKTKKVLYYALIGSLTVGASLILGFLSFTGAIALWPIVPLAAVFFVLSVGYEGEIYFQNIKGALDKLGFKRNYLRRQMAKKYLLNEAPIKYDETDPQFIQTYVTLLKLETHYKQQSQFSRKNRKELAAVRRSIKKMDKWFTQVLFNQVEPKSEMELELQNWLKEHNQVGWTQKANRHEFYYKLIAGFSVFAGLSMAFCTTYLLLGAFASIPVVLSLPPLLFTAGIITAALVAGAAYGLLTFKTTTDLLDNDTVQTWLKKQRHDLFEKPTLGAILKRGLNLVLLVLAVALTICTAGTWWTVIKQTRPLFPWMAKIPAAIMMIFPIINGISSLSFNFENTAESFEMVEDIKLSSFRSLAKNMVEAWRHLQATETIWQQLNPFRILIKLTFTPLRVLLFLGHLVSIALTSDRLPGVPQIVSFMVGLICEGFEDLHYFFSSHDHHGAESDPDSDPKLISTHLTSHSEHNHDNDLPTWVLRVFFYPLFYLSALWDHVFSEHKDWHQTMDKFKLLGHTHCHPHEYPESLEVARRAISESSAHLSKLSAPESDQTKPEISVVVPKAFVEAFEDHLIRHYQHKGRANPDSYVRDLSFVKTLREQADSPVPLSNFQATR